MSHITGLRFRGTYYSPPASTAEACVALAADHLAFAALALLGGPHWQHGAKQQAISNPIPIKARARKSAQSESQHAEKEKMCSKSTDHML